MDEESDMFEKGQDLEDQYEAEEGRHVHTSHGVCTGN